jgi:hypothetical protein
LLQPCWSPPTRALFPSRPSASSTSNLSQARYGVIDLNDFGDDLSIELGKISHAGIAGGTTLDTPTPTPMPEPTPLLLLGSGLALVARQIRRRWTTAR